MLLEIEIHKDIPNTSQTPTKHIPHTLHQRGRTAHTPPTRQDGRAKTVTEALGLGTCRGTSYDQAKGYLLREGDTTTTKANCTKPSKIWHAEA